MGISADSYWSHKAYAKQENLDFPLLADWFGTVGRLYDVWNNELQREHRTVFVIDSKGTIAYARVYRDEKMPNIDEAIDAIRRLQEQEEKKAG